MKSSKIWLGIGCVAGVAAMLTQNDTTFILACMAAATSAIIAEIEKVKRP